MKLAAFALFFVSCGIMSAQPKSPLPKLTAQEVLLARCHVNVQVEAHKKYSADGFAGLFSWQDAQQALAFPEPQIDYTQERRGIGYPAADVRRWAQEFEKSGQTCLLPLPIPDSKSGILSQKTGPAKIARIKKK